MSRKTLCSMVAEPCPAPTCMSEGALAPGHVDPTEPDVVRRWRARAADLDQRAGDTARDGQPGQTALADEYTPQSGHTSAIKDRLASGIGVAAARPRRGEPLKN